MKILNIILSGVFLAVSIGGIYSINELKTLKHQEIKKIETLRENTNFKEIDLLITNYQLDLTYQFLSSIRREKILRKIPNYKIEILDLNYPNDTVILQIKSSDFTVTIDSLGKKGIISYKGKLYDKYIKLNKLSVIQSRTYKTDKMGIYKLHTHCILNIENFTGISEERNIVILKIFNVINIDRFEPCNIELKNKEKINSFLLSDTLQKIRRLKVDDVNPKVISIEN